MNVKGLSRPWGSQSTAELGGFAPCFDSGLGHAADAAWKSSLAFCEDVASLRGQAKPHNRYLKYFAFVGMQCICSIQMHI